MAMLVYKRVPKQNPCKGKTDDKPRFFFKIFKVPIFRRAHNFNIFAIENQDFWFMFYIQ